MAFTALCSVKSEDSLNDFCNFFLISSNLVLILDILISKVVQASCFFFSFLLLFVREFLYLTIALSFSASFLFKKEHAYFELPYYRITLRELIFALLC